METRTLGRSGLPVTRIGLGLAALGRPGYITIKHADDLGHNYAVEAMQSHAHAVLDGAWQAGIRYFDAARSYGRAEVFLGSWLSARKIALEDVTVGSKWGYTYTADWQVDAAIHEVKELSVDVLHRQREESLHSLNGYLRLYQIHSATVESGVFEDQDVLDELARLHDDGLITGLTLSGAGQAQTLERAMQVSRNGRPLFDCVQATWNLLEPSAGAVLERAHRSGMGVIVKEVLANGRLTDKNDDPGFARQKALLEDVAAEANASLDALAMTAALAQPWADVVLSGAATPQQVTSNTTALQVHWSDRLAAMLAPLVETPRAYWQRRSELGWA